jgi:hypothetical protein
MGFILSRHFNKIKAWKIFFYKWYPSEDLYSFPLFFIPVFNSKCFLCIYYACVYPFSSKNKIVIPSVLHCVLLQSVYRPYYRIQFRSEVGFEVLTAVSTKIAVLWVVAPCSLVDVYQRFRGPCCLHHEGLMVNFYQTTWRYNPEDKHLRNLKSYFLKLKLFGCVS